MKNIPLPHIGLLLFLGGLALAACQDSDLENTPAPDGGAGITSSATVSLGAEGSAAQVQAPLTGKWTARTDAAWCCLSKMGGDGGEKVEVVAARNLTGKTRYATITFDTAPTAAGLPRKRHAALADSGGVTPPAPAEPGDSTGTAPATPPLQDNQLRIEQPPYTQPCTDLVLTAAEFDSLLSTVRVDVFNGTTAGEHLGTSTSGVNFQILTGGAQMAYYPTVPQGKETGVGIYVDLGNKGEKTADFYVGSWEKPVTAINRLRINQPPFFQVAQSGLSLKTDGVIHFPSGGKIYFGGGTEEAWSKMSGISHPDMPNSGRTNSRLMKVYDPSTNTLADAPSLPPATISATHGAGFDANGTPHVVLASGFYRLADGAWTHIGECGEPPLGAMHMKGQAYVLCAGSVKIYSLADGKARLATELKHAVPHGLQLDAGNVSYTHAPDGRLWFWTTANSAKQAAGLWRVNDDGTLTQHSLNEELPLGVEGNHLYTAFNADKGKYSALRRRDLTTGKKETLHCMVLEKLKDRHTDYAAGRIVVFGGLYSYGTGTRKSTPNGEIFTLEPAAYAPMSLTIVNK